MPKAGESWGIMSVQAGRVVVRRLLERSLRIGGYAELADVHAVDSMFFQHLVYVGRHGAEILTDYLGLMPGRFQTQDCIEFISRIVDVNCFAGPKAARDPKFTVESHDMIDAEHSRILEMMAQTLDIVTIALLSKPVGLQWRKAPVLALGEKAVRRRASAGVKRKHLTLAPDIGGVGVYSQREVELKCRPASSGLFRQLAHLFFGLPLHVEMILFDFFIVVAGCQPAIAMNRRPKLPWGSFALDFGAKRGVILRLRMSLNEMFESRSPPSRPVCKCMKQLLKNLALKRHQRSVFNQRRGA